MRIEAEYENPQINGLAMIRAAVIDPPRRATNVTIDPELLALAKSLQINISKVSERGVRRAVAARQAESWFADHEAAVPLEAPKLQGLSLDKDRLATLVAIDVVHQS